MSFVCGALFCVVSLCGWGSGHGGIATGLGNTAIFGSIDRTLRHACSVHLCLAVYMVTGGCGELVRELL